jgi:hypothetical protein
MLHAKYFPSVCRRLKNLFVIAPTFWQHGGFINEGEYMVKKDNGRRILDIQIEINFGRN